MVKSCKFIFVAVPTPFIEGSNAVDFSTLYNVLTLVNTNASTAGVSPTVIIKSAMTPNHIREFIGFFKSIRIVVSPEYLTERTSIHDFINQKVMILGGDKTDCISVALLFREHSICNNQCKVGMVTAVEASLIKYMENSFLAMKNIFNNQFKVLAKALEIEDFNVLLDAFYLDERMGVMPFRYTVPGPDGDIGYGGKCLPKDVKSIISMADGLKVDLTVMKEVDSYNEKIRTDKNWKTIEGAVIPKP
jgi:UDPglucose 6-dehydrogenase